MGLRADSAQSFSCAETTGPRQNRRGSLLTSERCVQSTRVDRSVSARLITTVSQAQWFKKHWQRLTGYQVVACVHLLLSPYGSKRGISVNRRTREFNSVGRLLSKSINMAQIPFGFPVSQNIMSVNGNKLFLLSGPLVLLQIIKEINKAPPQKKNQNNSFLDQQDRNTQTCTMKQ